MAFLDKFKGYRTVLFNGVLAVVPTLALVLEYLGTVDLAALGVTPEQVLVYSVVIKVANIALRSVTSTSVGQSE